MKNFCDFLIMFLCVSFFLIFGFSYLVFRNQQSVVENQPQFGRIGVAFLEESGKNRTLENQEKGKK